MTKYRVKNLHSTTREYSNGQGQQVKFTPGEQKTLKSRPPKSHSGWSVEIVEETSKPEDIEYKEEEGGDNN